MKYICALCFLLVVTSIRLAYSQTRLPILRAGNASIDVREGNNFYKGYWYASPEIKKDIYYTHRFSGAKKVTFISDKDSVSLNVESGHRYLIIILLNNKDTCLTEVNTTRVDYYKNGGKTATDTIPFTFGKDDRIYLECAINGSPKLRLFFDTGADNTIVFPSAFNKGLKLMFDDSIQNGATGGAQVRKLSTFNNKVSLNGLTWDNEAVMYVDKQLGDQADGTIGYNLFADKVMEFDFEKQFIVIHRNSPTATNGYQKFNMNLNGGEIPILYATMQINDSSYRKSFIMDMGATGCLFLGHSYAEKHNLYGKMKVIGEGNRSGAGNNTQKTQLVLLPELTIGSFSMKDLPINMQLPTGTDDGNEIGMNLLKRFNIILDYKKQQIYLKPNQLFNTACRYPVLPKK